MHGGPENGFVPGYGITGNNRRTRWERFHDDGSEYGSEATSYAGSGHSFHGSEGSGGGSDRPPPDTKTDKKTDKKSDTDMNDPDKKAEDKGKKNGNGSKKGKSPSHKRSVHFDVGTVITRKSKSRSASRRSRSPKQIVED